MKKKSASSGKAHSKGGLVYDKEGGYFLSHSLPRFPLMIDDKFQKTLPDNAGKFAQSWLCISINKENALSIASQLLIINPNIFIGVDEDKVDKDNETIKKLITNRGDPKLADQDHITVKSKLGKTFDIFSKSKRSEVLPWDEPIPSHFNDDFYVETWTKPDRLPNECKNKNKIFNVFTLKFSSFEFGHDNEHSKWAVSKKKNISCFGDLNRTGTQKQRGGFSICFENEGLSRDMRASILTSEECPKKLLFLS